MHSPLRVMHFLWQGEVGGAERAVYQLLREQIRDPALAPAIVFAQHHGPYWEAAHDLGCPVVALDLPHGHALADVRATAAKIRAADVHHFHAPEPVLMLASLLCRGVRRVYTHRGGMTDYGAKKRVQHRVAGFFLRHFFHAYSANTAHAALSAARLYGLDAGSLRVTYNGVDASLLEPKRTPGAVRSELGIEPGDFVLGTSANLKPWKRIDRLVEAVALIADPRLRLLVVGDGSDIVRLRVKSARLGVSHQVLFTGLQLHVADYLQVMDAFSLPSTELESFGNAAVEAMLVGLPTIIFGDGGGMLEHIVPGETGFVVRDQNELERTIRTLLADPERARAVGARARRDVSDRYTPARSAAAYRELYARAVGARNGSPS